MKILVLSPTFPLPQNSGSKIRIFQMIQSFSKKNKITFAGLIHEKIEYEHIEEMKKYCGDVYVYPRKSSKMFSIIKSFFSIYPYRVIRFKNEELMNKVDEILMKENFDLIWINFMNMAFFIQKPINSLVLLDQHNNDELMWKKYYEEGNILQKIFVWWEIRKLRKFFKKYINFFNAILSVSKEDADFTKNKAPASVKVYTVPNGVDTLYFTPQDKELKRNIILFCGSMDVTMNIDAVKRFATEIFPQIKSKITDSEFWVAGRSPPKKIKDLESIDGVKVTGTVEDVRPYYERAKVFVAPFRFGGGTKLKILEAMAMRVPVVSTSVGCQGLEVENEKHVFIEDNDENFIHKIITLMEDDNLREKIEENGRNLVLKNYSWSIITKNINYQLNYLRK